VILVENESVAREIARDALDGVDIVLVEAIDELLDASGDLKDASVAAKRR
jgi:hypothetical protein